MRIVYYAFGGGLGHLVRARAFLHTLNLTRDAVVLTASDAAHDRRIVGDLDVLHAPPALDANPGAFRAWVLDALARLAPDVFCTDVFPVGILGELCDLPSGAIAFWHVARRLRWSAYAPCVSGVPPHYARVFRVEGLDADQQRFLEHCSDGIEDLELIDPPADEARIDVPERYWLIVHSGPDTEVAQLIAYADEVRSAERLDVPLLAITRRAPRALPPNTRVIDAYPATPYFAAAQRIFSAGGFNTLRQARAWREKLWVLPMERRFDQQAGRAGAVLPMTE